MSRRRGGNTYGYAWDGSASAPASKRTDPKQVQILPDSLGRWFTDSSSKVMHSLFTKTAVAPTLRYYQTDAIESTYDFLRRFKDRNPCIVLPTGAGKTHVMSRIANDAVTRWNGRVLILAHVKELLEQCASSISEAYPQLKVGIYSAGLGKRESRADVLVAGIQSVYDKGLKLCGADPFRLVMVDESHRIPTSGDGMYRRMLGDLQAANPKIRVVGLTATPYRLKGGYVCGPDNFLNEVCYEVGVRELIAKGYLCPLISPQVKSAVDVSQIKVTRGEYDETQLAEAFDVDPVVEAACDELVSLTTNRNSTIVFCCSVAHSEHVALSIGNRVGHRYVGVVTGETSDNERALTIEKFKCGAIRYLINVNVLCEGFDARRVDCVTLLRSTLSPGLYYQMVGRGLRLHESKQDCLVLDFGHNVETHGCIDDIRVKTPKSKGGAGEPAAKACPNCKLMQPAGLRVCGDCGYEWPAVERGINHQDEASHLPITSDQVPVDITYKVDSVSYVEHTKREAKEDTPKTMRVMYYDGLQLVAQEWVCVEHRGRALENAIAWWNRRTDMMMPGYAAEAARIGSLGYLAEPTSVTVRKYPNNKFPSIVAYELGERIASDSIEVAVDEWGDEVRVK